MDITVFEFLPGFFQVPGSLGRVRFRFRGIRRRIGIYIRFRDNMEQVKVGPIPLGQIQGRVKSKIRTGGKVGTE
jgi:hypothetical protein